MNVWVLLPAHNEEVTLPSILQELRAKGVATLVVDDGSIDNTYSIAQQQADEVIRNHTNLGKGKTLQKGITYLLEHKRCDYIITMDADGQHSPLDLDIFLKEAQKGEQFVVGDRMDNPEGMPFLRVITNTFMSWLISTLIGQRISDTQCGFRLIQRKVLEKIQITTNKFEIETELIVKGAYNGVPIKSVPIRSIYSRSRKSRIHPVIDTLRFIRFMFGLCHGRK